MGKKTHSVEESDRTISPANARPPLFGSGDKVFEALAMLRAVRKPGKNKLSLQEAIAVSQEQGEAFARWQGRNTPIRRIQVLVEGVPVMTISLDESSVDLESFNFYVTSPRDAVMQILKADEGEEPVVLRNFPLGTVDAKEVIDITPLPNGQLYLKIAPPESGRFVVGVAFAEGKDVSLLSAVNRLRSKDKVVGLNGKSDKRSPRFPLPLWEPLTNRCSWGFAVLLVCLALTAIISLGQLTSSGSRVTREDSVAGQPAKTKQNTRKRQLKVRLSSTSPREKCCDQEVDQNTSTVFSVEQVDGNILVPVEEEGTIPESLDTQIAGIAPSTDPAQPVLIEKPTIKISETETKGPAPFASESNRVSIPIDYSNSEGQPTGARDSSRVRALPFTQRTRFEFHRRPPN